MGRSSTIFRSTLNLRNRSASVQELEDEARKLPAAERARLAEALWDSIADEANINPEVLPLSDDQRAELDRRLADYRAHPETSVPWEVIKARMLGATEITLTYMRQ